MLKKRQNKYNKSLLKDVLLDDDTERRINLGVPEISWFRTALLSHVNSPPKLKTVIKTDQELFVNQTKPNSRYGHSAASFKDGFAIYGGKLSNGSLGNDLWFYNVTEGFEGWNIRANYSLIVPPKLTRHTLTLANDYLYIFGGSMESGEFSSR